MEVRCLVWACTIEYANNFISWVITGTDKRTILDVLIWPEDPLQVLLAQHINIIQSPSSSTVGHQK